jgi:DNA polymerase elongation subunit (family B)
LKVLLLDIETAPNTAFVWRLAEDYISPDQLINNSYTLCVSAKWLGKSVVHYYGLNKDSRAEMLKAIHQMMDEADVIIHYNGVKFDIPTLNMEFALEGLPPPSPAKQVDLLKVVKKQFKFTSNKLDFVCRRLGLGAKVHHKGMALWEGCMAGNPDDWKVMEKYNKQDVVLLEKLYKKLLPWIPNHPNRVLWSKTDCCPRCGSTSLQLQPPAFTATGAYMKLSCRSCHGWIRGPRLKEPKSPSLRPLG